MPEQPDRRAEEIRQGTSQQALRLIQPPGEEQVLFAQRILHRVQLLLVGLLAPFRPVDEIFKPFLGLPQRFMDSCHVIVIV